jgi:hypothetical protein
MWSGLPEFAETCRTAYRRDVWADQPGYVEAWLEKDALSGIFENELEPYGVTLNVGRGYDGWDSLHKAAERYKAVSEGKHVTVLYFGDFDPSGEDMYRSLGDRLARLGTEPEIIKCALTADDMHRYNLPPNRAKTTDSRTRKFVAENGGDETAELDALPVTVLRDRLRQEVESRMDLDALNATKEREEAERALLVDFLKDAK